MSQKKLKKVKKDTGVLGGIMAEAEGEMLGEGGLWEIIKENWKWMVILICVAVITFANGMRGDFVSDDYASITLNPNIGNLSVMGGQLNSAFLVNYLVFKLFGFGSSVPFHLANMFFYWLNLVLVFALGWKISKSKWVTVLGSLLFAVHPIHVEAVSWISGRIYLILCFYALMSFWMFIRYMETRKLWYLAGLLGFFVVGSLTDKPRPFVIILLVVLYFMYAGVKKIRINWYKAGAIILGGGLVATLIALPNIQGRIVAVNGGINGSGSIFYNPFFQYPTGISKYLQLLVAPNDLTLYHTMFVFPTWLNH